VQELKTFDKNKRRFYGFVLKTACCLFSFTSNAQDCPHNIDFETGTFEGWICYTGNTYESNGENVIALNPTTGPVFNRHTMYSSFPGDGFDEYGGFPVNCPNGSGHSIRLGNNSGGGQAEGISYDFTIPANQNVYNLIYNYAVVFEDPSHLEFQQPRMEIEISNATTHQIIECSSFTFFPNGSPLPGFNLSPISASDSPVWYKNWSAVSINLNGHAGESIRLFFKTADCTFRRHFGYAYIDVNSECSGNFAGASFCPDDANVHLVAPYGYQQYNWYNSSFTQLLGTDQVLVFAPPPPVGTSVAVVVTPYDGYGCLDTLYTQLTDNLVITPHAGRDTVSCNAEGVPIGELPKQGVLYSWTPTTGLTDPDVSNPFANPATTTSYILFTSSTGGGCRGYDTVVVTASLLDTSLQFRGKESFCLNSGDSAVLTVQPTDTIQWYKDNVPINGATQTVYNVTQTGEYHARLANKAGCALLTASRHIDISSIPLPGFTTAVKDQCLKGNSFSFTNSSTNAVGPMYYRWIFGDGTEASTRDAVHVYTKAGTYRVKLIVNSNAICADSSSMIIHVYQNAIPLFIAKNVCVNLPVQLINNTADTMNSPITYLWSFGNGQFSNLRNPPPPVYNVAGIYSINLSVNTAQCPLPVITLQQNIKVEDPRPGINYGVETAVENLPLVLQARQFGGTVLWKPATSLNNSTVFNPVFKGVSEQLYTIEITTASGCLTVDTQLVKIVKQIAIYVPAAFTPDDDGLNDHLKPTMYGIKTLNYFKVFNRWGQLMFESNRPYPGWDGMYKGVRQEMQTYVWIVDAIGADGNKYIRKGTSILLR